jgi:hypothetical protein
MVPGLMTMIREFLQPQKVSVQDMRMITILVLTLYLTNSYWTEYQRTVPASTNIGTVWQLFILEMRISLTANMEVIIFCLAKMLSLAEQ